jgi:hypothetical protein
VVHVCAGSGIVPSFAILEHALLGEPRSAVRPYNGRVTGILKVSADQSSEEDELDFEIAYQRSLTTAQRFEMMLARSRQLAKELIRRGHRRPVEVVKRPRSDTTSPR